MMLSEQNASLENETPFIHSVIGTKSVGSQRFSYGILERPAAYVSYEEVSYKVAVIGKSGVGKTSLITKLAGISPQTAPSDTVGIRVTDVYWPVKIWNKSVLFKLQCWDAGEAWSKKYGHIASSCIDKADIRVYVFSYENSKSFADVSKMMSETLDRYQSASLVIGTRHSGGKSEVSLTEMHDFEIAYRLQILSLHLGDTDCESESKRMDMILNKLCEQLWIRDQQYIMNQSVTV